MRNSLIILLFFTLIFKTLFSQSVSVSVTKLYYNVGRGENNIQTVTLKNNSTNKQSFQITFCGFESPGNKGKTVLITADTNKNSCAKWLNVTPSSFILNAGESKDISVELKLPDIPEAEKTKWAAMQIIARNDNDKEQNTGLDVTENMKIIVHIFQTPPNLKMNKLEITNFENNDSNKTIILEVKNTGETILICNSSVEFNNIITNKKQNVKSKPFTLLPNTYREIDFDLPDNIEKGKYLVTGYVEYNNNDNVLSAKQEIEIKE
ncbi:MAG TPA: hypothetical protein PKK00_12045 [Bacteroidales bacterium]|nr:hypothetical protein [Bacteroidales bacterium]HPS17529.1 hypothetical protein [Bacteroidales bacterium]